MSYGKDDWLLLLGRILMTTVFCQSLQHHLPDYPAWIGFLTHQGVPYPEIGGVLADTTIFISVVLLLTGWYPKLLVLLLTIFILFASGFGHQFWNLSGDARAAQYANFTKNFSLIGGLVFYWVAGPGRLVLRRPW